MSLKNNTILLNNLLEQANALPELSNNFIDTSNGDVTPDDIISGKIAYAKGEQVVGNIPTKTVLNVTSLGKEVTIPSGYYPDTVKKSVPEAP
jgi:hypothetical protein